jgi:anti-sigma factor RsiW
MSAEKLSKETLNHYLLGDLSENEAEKVEARYFADPAFLCELIAARDDLLDAGVRGELPTLEMQKLNARLQVLPALRDQAAFAHSLQQALAQPAAENDQTGPATASALPTPATTSRITQSKAWFALPRWVWSMAVLCLLLSVTWIGLKLTERGREASFQKAAQSAYPHASPALPTGIEKQTPSLPDLVAAAPPKAPLPALKQSSPVHKPGISVATFVLSAGLVRGAQEAPELVVATAKTINLQLELAPPLEHPQQALLENDAGTLVWQQRPLRVQTYHGVRVAICHLPLHLLSEGAYQLRLSRLDGSEAIYYFRLKKS